MGSRLTAEQLILAAFQLAEQKPTRGARFAQLLRQVSPDFAPSEYNAPTFRAFLEGCPSVVRIEQEEGKDIVASPAGDATNRTIDSSQPLRRDLWMAFTLVNERLLRFYDRKHDCVVTLPRDREVDSPDMARVTRAMVERDGERFVPIAPMSSEEMLVSVRRFAEGLDGDERDMVEGTLGKPLWFREFQAVLRGRPALASAWRRVRTELVMARVKQWQRERGVNVPSLFRRPYRAEPLEERVAENVPSADERPGTRQLILAALARMPTSLLLTIPIPAEYWLNAGE